MSKYSETMGSFTRTGSYPLEANYIFPSEEALKEFYSDELNATLLHKGLLKIVEVDQNGKQSLWWVVKKLTNDELEFKKLIDFENIDELYEKLQDLENQLLKEIEDRKRADTAIWGEEDPSILDEDLNSIKKLIDAIQLLQEDLDGLLNQIGNLKEELKATVGTEEDDIISYLETLPYQSLTEVANELNFFLTAYDEANPEINTWPELKSFLEGYTDKDKLMWLLQDLYDKILGNPYPTEDFRTLRGIEDFVRIFKAESENTDANLQKELDQTQVGVGLSLDGSYSPDKETYYLLDATSVMNALKILDSLINEAINNVNLLPGETESALIDIIKEVDKTTIYARVKLSSEQGNDILIKNDGLYHNVDSEYENGILTIKVNGQVRQLHVLGLSMIVESARYNPDTESIIIIFKLQSGDTQEVVIPVSALIQEWEVDNSLPEKVVQLEKQRVFAGGADKLSADVRLSSNKYNILVKDGNTLLVDGRAENIVFEGDLSVKEKINQLELKDNEQQSQLEQLLLDLDSEVDRAKEAESNLKDDLHEEVDRATKEEHRLEDLIKAEKERAESAEFELQTTIEKEIEKEKNRAELEEEKIRNELAQEIEKEKNRAEKEEHRIEDLIKENSQNFESDLDELRKRIEKEENRAQDAESDLSDKLDLEIKDREEADQELDDKLNNLIKTVGAKEDGTANPYIPEEVNYVKGNVVREDIKILDHELKDVNDRLDREIERATEKEIEIEKLIDQNKEEVDEKLGSITLTKVGDLEYELFVDGESRGIINIPQDQFLVSVDLLDLSTLHFVFNTTTGIVEQDIDLQAIIDKALSEGGSIYIAILNIRNYIDSEIDELLKMILAEIERALNKEKELEESIIEVDSELEKEIERATNSENSIISTIDSITINKDEELGFYELIVDGVPRGARIMLPKDKHLRDVQLYGNLLQFFMVTEDGETVKTVDLTPIFGPNLDEIYRRLQELQNLINNILGDIVTINATLTVLDGKIDSEITRATTKEEALQDKINDVKDDLNYHIHDYDNPHRVNKDQVGLDLVDNTSDLDKPISNATQEALDGKADIIHTHSKTDIIDLSEFPIVEGIVDRIGDMPREPRHLEKWILETPNPDGQTFTYELWEWDATTLEWHRKSLEIGTVSSVANGNVWKLNTSGQERILDASDYKYFYNKLWDETKDLIEDIDWEEDDTADTNEMIRLKITYKTNYGDPDSEGANEVTNPYTQKAVKYIDIEKSRFLANAFSRPATAEDVQKGYGSELGEPILVLVFTTGDYVGIPLKDMVNIYDEIDTDSINLDVSDWTGDPSTSYKINANLNIAATKGKDNSISLHINSTNNDKGLYAELHTLTTNSIALNPSTGGSGNTLKYLTADLKINNTLNNASDILLSIDSSGLSAKFVWGDYD